MTAGGCLPRSFSSPVRDSTPSSVRPDLLSAPRPGTGSRGSKGRHPLCAGNDVARHSTRAVQKILRPVIQGEPGCSPCYAPVDEIGVPRYQRPRSAWIGWLMVGLHRTELT